MTSDARRVTGKTKPLYRKPPPKPAAKVHSSESKAQSPKSAPHSSTVDSGLATSDFSHPHFIAPSHFTLREDGSIESSAAVPAALPDKPRSAAVPAASSAGNSRSAGVSPASLDVSSQSRRDACATLPRLVFSSDTPFVRLYCGNCLELLDAIAAKYPEGRFDAIFADPPYFLSNGGITCHAGKMVKVDKGDWDVSRGPELNHEFNTEWLRRCQRVLKPNGTIWVTGTHHVIFSIGYALQQLGFKILNDIAWEKPNPPPNLSCRYFTHSTETVLWAAKNEKSKHVFNYQEMRKVTGKQMKTVWRKEEFFTEANKENEAGLESEKGKISVPDSTEANEENKDLAGAEKEKSFVSSVSFCSNPEEKVGVPFCSSSIWTLGAPSSGEKSFGKHPTQKPVALVERCLLASTNEGDLVLDPFLGNGTTAVASLRLKRGCVGIELDEAHAQAAAKRIAAEIHKPQPELGLKHG